MYMQIWSMPDYDVTNGIIFMMLYKVCIMGPPSKIETKELLEYVYVPFIIYKENANFSKPDNFITKSN